MALKMSSPPRELTRTFQNEPQHIPITDVTSDENGRNVEDPGRDLSGRRSSMSREISELTQRQLTSEVTIARCSIRKSKRGSSTKSWTGTSQEVHMFNHAQTIISEMQSAFTVEDQGCIRRIEMFGSPKKWIRYGIGWARNRAGNRAESVLQERNVEYSEELARVRTKIWSVCWISRREHFENKARTDNCKWCVTTKVFKVDQLSYNRREK